MKNFLYLYIVIKRKTVMTANEIKNTLDGCEVNSLTYEGVVYVSNGKAYMDGDVIRVSWKTLWNEYIGNEF
jgi:hypothetical protein